MEEFGTVLGESGEVAFSLWNMPFQGVSRRIAHGLECVLGG